MAWMVPEDVPCSRKVLRLEVGGGQTPHGRAARSAAEPQTRATCLINALNSRPRATDHDCQDRSDAKSTRTFVASGGTSTINQDDSSSISIENWKNGQQAFSRRARSTASDNTFVEALSRMRSRKSLARSTPPVALARKRCHSLTRSVAASEVSVQAIGIRNVSLLCHLGLQVWSE
jgi:hypothetical protein